MNKAFNYPAKMIELNLRRILFGKIRHRRKIWVENQIEEVRHAVGMLLRFYTYGM